MSVTIDSHPNGDGTIHADVRVTEDDGAVLGYSTDIRAETILDAEEMIRRELKKRKRLIGEDNTEVRERAKRARGGGIGGRKGIAFKPKVYGGRYGRSEE